MVVENTLIRPYFLGGRWHCGVPLDSHDHVLLSSKALYMFHPGGSDGVITDDSPQVVDVAASSNQGQARLANKTSYKPQQHLKVKPP